MKSSTLKSTLPFLLLLFQVEIAASNKISEGPTVSEEIPVEGGIPNGATEDEGRYIVKFKPGSLEFFNRLKTAEANEDGGERRLRKLTKSPKSAKSSKAEKRNFLTIQNAEIIYADTEEEAAEWETHNDVEYVERDTKVYMMEEFADEGETPYGIMQAQALSVSDEFVSNRKVCVVDSGYDINHPDLQNDYVTGTEGGAGMWSEPKDSHGTHCAGTIAAVGNNDGVRGVVRSGKMNLHIVRIFNDEGNWAWSSSLVNAVQACIDAKSNVVSMSLGGGGFNQMSASAYKTMLDVDDVLLIAAAGNGGNAAYSYPASYDAVMSVAAVDRFGSKAWFSQYNDQVDIAAAGVAVKSTIVGGEYGFKSGTSMATPHVAGVAALVWSHHSSKSAKDIRMALTKTAKKADGTTERDDEFGHGIVQAASAEMYLRGDFPRPSASPTESTSPSVSPTESMSPTELCTDSPKDWYDVDGSFYNCAWYAIGSNCANLGDSFENLGTTANQACCGCGGGARDSGTVPHPSASPSESTFPTEVCTDSPQNWHDVNGIFFDCDWYGDGVDRCSNFGDLHEYFGKTANQACCVCGGGNDDSPSSSPTKVPSSWSTHVPSGRPSNLPTHIPSERPSDLPTHVPSGRPSDLPTHVASGRPSNLPTHVPSGRPSNLPTHVPSVTLSSAPSVLPSSVPAASSPPASVPTVSGPPATLPTVSGPPGSVPTISGPPASVPTISGPPAISPTVSGPPVVTNEESLAPSAACTDDPPGWYDIDGGTFDCDWYASGSRCADFGDLFENFGTVANSACCACQNEGCSDIADWHDIDGASYDCAWYARGNFCTSYGDSYANFGYTANKACCACGGGE